MPQDLDYHFASFFPDEKVRPFAYLLSQSLREGHICIAVKAETEIKTPFGFATLDLLNQVSDKMLSKTDTTTPFIFRADYLYLQRYYRYESNLVEQVMQRLDHSRKNKNEYQQKIEALSDLIKQQGADNDINGLSVDEKIDWQLIAVLRSLMNDFSIITGGPGTGKTTTLSKFLRILFTMHPGCNVALAAPTGKASMRMLESLKEKSVAFPNEIQQQIQQLKPYTLHRLLGFQQQSIYFKHNAENPLPFDWVIVDEASMIDLPLFSKLLSACKPTTRLLLLGDQDQLASVEAGSLLGDLCAAAGKLNRFSKQENEWLNKFIASAERQIPDTYSTPTTLSFLDCITSLRFSHRFKERGSIGQLSLSIINGNADLAIQLLNSDQNQQIGLINEKYDHALIDFVKGYIQYMEEPEVEKALVKINQLRVLVAVKEGDFGLHNINRKTEKILNSIRPDLIQPNSGFYHNRPVIVTKNNYDLGLYNGDIGIVRKDPVTKNLKVYFEAEEKGKPCRSFTPASLSDCETVFAMTIHKSQGSEFEKVMVVMPNQIDNPVLTRELLYTGVTRAKSHAYIMGTEEVLREGILRQVVRLSGVHERLIK